MNTLIEKFLAIVLFVAFNAFANWTGSISEPENTRMIDGKSFYVINTADELAWFANKVNKGSLTINAILESDIVFGINENTTSAANWTPIGKDSTKMYEGIFDGAGHSIFGILSSDAKFVGVWGVVGQNGIVKNVYVKNGDINGTNRDVKSYYAGGVAAINNGTIQNVINENKVTVSNVSLSLLYAGGISAINNGNIIGCQNKSEITAKILSTVNTYPVAYSGGISGYNAGVISDCKNNAKIRAYSKTSNVMKKSDAFAGGIAGYNQNNVNNSSNSGDVFAHGCKSNTGDFTSRSAGIVGYNTSTVLNCYNQGNTSVCLLDQSSNIDESGCGINYSQRYPSCVGGVVAYGTAKNSFDIVANSYWLNKEEFQSSAENMQKDQFAWSLNTTNGTTSNSDIWSRGTSGYPSFANGDSLAIHKIIFNDKGEITNRYANYQGLVTFPDNPEPSEGFVFIGWYNADDVRVKSSTVFSADQTIHSVYIEATDVFWTINFYNSDAQSTLLETKQYQNGSIVTYNGPTPTRTASAEYTYTFKGWDVEPTNALGDYDYHAVYDSTVRYYVIDFRGVGGIIASDSYPYGSIPACDKTPTRSSTAEWNYSFKGWSPEIVAVTKNATYKAVFDSSKVKYNVKFMKGDIVMKSENVEYGALPTLPYSSLPTDASKYTWDKEIVPVTSAETYSIKYYVDFIDYNGKILKETVAYDYGSFAVTPSSPKRENTAKYTYTFKRWTPSTTSAVIEPVTYKAVYDSVINKYWIVCTIDGVFRSRNQYTYGSMPTCPVILPENTAQYVYSFGGMDKEIVPVIEDATYNVIINRAMQKYTITFRDFDGITLKESVQYDYGTLAADIEVPSNPQRADEIKYTYSGIANRYKYTFKGWKPRLADVTGNATYVAQYDSMIVTAETNNDNTILFKKGKTANGELLVESSSWKIQILGAKVGSAYAIFDMQGRVLKKGRVESANFNIPMTMAGNYLVRVGNQTQQITIK